jgi:hypothetical protein
MASRPDLVLRFAAMAGLAILLSAATPAMAAKSAAGAGEATAAKTVSSINKRHAVRRDYRRVSFMRGNRDCSHWCGRQFVLMVGVAY